MYVTGVTPAARIWSNSDQNELYNKSNINQATVLLIKTSEFAYMSYSSLKYLFFKKYWQKKIWGSSFKISLFHIGILGPKNSQRPVTFLNF